MKVVVYFCSLLIAIVCIALALEWGSEQFLPDAYRGYLIDEGNDSVKWAFGPFEPSQPSTGFNTPIQIKKPDETIRIVSVGASGTEGWLSAKAVFRKYGQRWEPNSLSSYSRVVELNMNEISDSSSRRVEVINLGVAAYNATDVIRMLKDSMQLEPDLLLIHIGVNEAWTSERSKWTGFLNDEAPFLFDDIPYFYAELGYEVFTETKAGWRTLSRKGNAFSPLALVKSKPKPIVPEPPGRAAGLVERLDNYQSELDRLGRFLKRKEVPAIFLVPTQNLSGFLPFGSMAKAGTSEKQLEELNRLLIEALAEPGPELKSRLLEILEIDNGIAEANFQLGKIYLAEQNYEKAREYFWTANNRDIILKRPPVDFPDLTRKFVAENEFLFLDVLEDLQSKSSNGNVGNEWIYDDVHPVRKAQFEMGKEIAGIIVGSGLVDAEGYSGDLQKLPSLEEYNEWTNFDRKAKASVSYLRAAHNFLAFGRYKQRLQWDPSPEHFISTIIKYLDDANEFSPSDQSLYFSVVLNLFLDRREAAEDLIDRMGCRSTSERAAQVRVGIRQLSWQLFRGGNSELNEGLQRVLVSGGCLNDL